MKRSLKRILAAFMAVLMLFGGAMSASAAQFIQEAPKKDFDWSIEDIPIEGVIFVDYYDGANFFEWGFERFSNARSFEFWSFNDEIISVDNNSQLETVSYGATIIEIDQYNRNDEYIDSVYYIAVVNDDEDWSAEGEIRNAYDTYVEVNYKNTGYIYPDCDVRGDVYVYTIAPWFTGDAADIYSDGTFYGYAKGSDTVTCIAVDTNGNYKYFDATIDVTYSFIQWIIVILLFGWIWY